jgi:DNA replication and repair protein RecF
MLLAWLHLDRYRCYETLELEPDAGINVLVGDNGAGKTTLLEAIGYLASLKSFRRSPDGSLIREGSGSAILRGEFRAASRPLRVEVEIPAEGRRRVLVNGKRPAGRAELLRSIPLVAFLPDDLDLVKRGPVHRREYLDDLAAALWPAAGAEQQDFDRVLRQRNALLRREGRDADPSTLDVWDERLAALGATLIERRLGLLDVLGPRLSELYADLGEEPEHLAWRYETAGLGRWDPGREGLRAGLGEAIAAARRVDLERRVTTVGPHRDEVVFMIGERDLRTRSSQGEQRTVALGLRVAAFEMLRAERTVSPMLILDDVFSELDPGRSRRLVEKLPSGQVFISTAREEEVPLSGSRWVITPQGVEPQGSG